MNEEQWNSFEKSVADQPEFEAIGKLMEEMANAPKEEMGKRQPGEKGSYERMVDWEKEKHEEMKAMEERMAERRKQHEGEEA